MQTVQVLIEDGVDSCIYYEDVNGNTVTRTLAVRLINGGAFYGDIGNGRRIMIEESQ
jgi:hypothetical protein